MAARFDVNDKEWEDYICKGGVQKLMKRITELFGDEASVELGSRLDDFFDSLRRRGGESMRAYCDRFEIQYKKYTEIGEPLSETARVNRLLKGSRLDSHDQRQLLRKCHGEFDYQCVIQELRLYSDIHHRSASHTGKSGHRGHADAPCSQRPMLRHRSHEGSFSQRKRQVAGNGFEVGNKGKRKGPDGEDHVGEGEAGAPEESPVYEPDMADTGIPRCKEEPEVETKASFAMPDELAREIWCCKQVFLTQPFGAMSQGYRRRIEQNRWVCDILKEGGPKSPEEKRVIREIKNRIACAS